MILHFYITRYYLYTINTSITYYLIMHVIHFVPTSIIPANTYNISYILYVLVLIPLIILIIIMLCIVSNTFFRSKLYIYMDTINYIIAIMNIIIFKI